MREENIEIEIDIVKYRRMIRIKIHINNCFPHRYTRVNFFSIFVQKLLVLDRVFNLISGEVYSSGAFIILYLLSCIKKRGSFLHSFTSGGISPYPIPLRFSFFLSLFLSISLSTLPLLFLSFQLYLYLALDVFR